MIKYVFVIGGVVFFFGKGIVVVFFVVIFELCGLKVIFFKFDFYINVDFGMMSLFQYGEVFVMEDGVEIDFDFGYYECFISMKMCKVNNFMIGQIYELVICKECCGDYFGKIVQVILYIMNEIQVFIECGVVLVICGELDVVIVEIGGMVGDIELLLFFEVVCQMSLCFGCNSVCFVYLMFVLYVVMVGELKMKLIQYSVQKLCEIGILLYVLLCCVDCCIFDDELKKILMFLNVFEDVVILVWDVDSIYKILQMLYDQGFDWIICEELKLLLKDVDLSMWLVFVEKFENLKQEVMIGMVGKYVDLIELYKLLIEVLCYVLIYMLIKVNIEYIDLEEFEMNGVDSLKYFDVVLVLGGFGCCGMEGKIVVVCYVCELKVLYFGICFGMQFVVIEFVCDVVGLKQVNSMEFDLDMLECVVVLIIEWYDCEGKVEMCIEEFDFGGMMCFGLQCCLIKLGMMVEEIYGKDVNECYCYCYEVNNCFVFQFEVGGFIISVCILSEDLLEMMELLCLMYLWFVGVQFYLEFMFMLCDGYFLFKLFVEVVFVNK